MFMFQKNNNNKINKQIGMFVERIEELKKKKTLSILKKL